MEIRGHETLELANEIIRQASHLGGVPFWYYNDSSVTRPFIQGASEAQFEALG